MASWLAKGLLLYLFFAIAFSFSAPDVVFSDGNPAKTTVLAWFDINYNGNVSIGSNLSINSTSASSTLVEVPSESATGTFLSIFDPIAQIINWAKLFFEALFSPITLLNSSVMTNAPPAVMLILGLPLVFLVIIGIIMFFRGVS